MTTDWKALCAELLHALESEGYAHWVITPDEDELCLRAREALAQSEPEGPREIIAVRPMMEQIAAMGDCIDQQTIGRIMAISKRAAAWLTDNPPGQPVVIEPRGCPTPGACSCVVPEPEGPSDEELWELYQGPGTFSPVEFARAVLARWGRPIPQPVPVSERLPGPGDCEDEGWAWFFNKRIGWRQAVLPVSPGFSHWLPSHALPLPTSNDKS